MAEKKRAVGLVVVEADEGCVIPKGAELVRADGAAYETLAELTVGTEESASVEVQARDAGADGRADAGTPLKFTKPVDGAADEALVGADGLELEAPKSKGPKQGPPKQPADDAAPPENDCTLHLVVNGRGAVRQPARYRGGKGGRHAASYTVVVGGVARTVEVEDLPLHNPRDPIYPSLER